jgi:hypothetical protein
MIVPGAERAVVDVRKLTAYCLDEDHVIGKHKARVFRSALGLRPDNAFELIGYLKSAVMNTDAELGVLNEFGQRYIVDFELAHGSKSAAVRSVWIVDTGSDFPRLVTCFVI